MLRSKDYIVEIHTYFIMRDLEEEVIYEFSAEAANPITYNKVIDAKLFKWNPAIGENINLVALDVTEKLCDNIEPTVNNYERIEQAAVIAGAEISDQLLMFYMLLEKQAETSGYETLPLHFDDVRRESKAMIQRGYESTLQDLSNLHASGKFETVATIMSLALVCEDYFRESVAEKFGKESPLPKNPHEDVMGNNVYEKALEYLTAFYSIFNKGLRGEIRFCEAKTPEYKDQRTH